MLKLTSVVLSCYFAIGLVEAVPDGRVVGGFPAMEGQFPHQVSLRQHAEHFCGGSIISKDFILTAAHCVVDFDKMGLSHTTSPRLLTVSAGTINRYNKSVEVAVAKIIRHEAYLSKYSHEDIALLKLARPLMFSKTIQPIALPTTDILDASPIIVSGWGRLSQGGIRPEQLQWALLTSISTNDCNKLFQYNTEKYICLRHPKDNGICAGDSGGPAISNNEIVGIASFTRGPCGNEDPDGFVRVFRYIDWIKKNMAL